MTVWMGFWVGFLGDTIINRSTFTNYCHVQHKLLKHTSIILYALNYGIDISSRRVEANVGKWKPIENRRIVRLGSVIEHTIDSNSQVNLVNRTFDHRIAYNLTQLNF